MKVYIAGKITNNPNYKKQFAAAEHIAESRGHVAINPSVLPEGMKAAEYMAICLPMLLMADRVWMLPNWKDSGGARVEHELAQYVGKDIRYMDELFEGAAE